MTPVRTNSVLPTHYPAGGKLRFRSHDCRVDDASLFLEIFVKNREDFTVPENVDETRSCRRTLCLHNLVNGYLNQGAGWIRKAAARTRLQLHGVNRHGYLITNWWLAATHDRSLLLLG